MTEINEKFNFIETIEWPLRFSRYTYNTCPSRKEDAQIFVASDNYYQDVCDTAIKIAKNIKVSYENHDLFCLDSDKLPFEFLEPSKSFELSLIIYTNSPRKVLVTTEWENEFNEKNTKTQLCDF